MEVRDGPWLHLCRIVNRISMDRESTRTPRDLLDIALKQKAEPVIRS